jgi:hypothetical protein
MPSPGDVEVLPRLSGVLDEDFLGSAAGGAEALRPRRLAGGLEERERAGRVDRAALEVPRARAATSAAVAQRTAATAGESESRMGAQEQESVGASVPVKAAEDVQFTR